MECYKKLNAELISEIRAMRDQNAIYRREIIETNELLMNERRLRVEQQQYFLKTLDRNYRDMVNKLQSNAELSTLLSSNNSVSGHSSNMDEIVPHNRRSSKEILENFRLSNQCHRQRIRSISPILQSTSSSCSNKEDSVSVRISNTFRNLSSSTEQKSPNDSNKMEESSSRIVPSDDDSNENQDTNEAEDGVDSSAEDCVTKLKIRLSQINLLENINEEESDESTVEAEECIQPEPRKSYNRNNRSSLCDLTNCGKLVLRTSPLEEAPSPVNLPSPICGFDKSAQNFNCSTPCSKVETFSDGLTEYSHTMANTRTCGESTLEERTERPRRSCRPSNLKERSLLVKLRNDKSGKTKKEKAYEKLKFAINFLKQKKSLII